MLWEGRAQPSQPVTSEQAAFAESPQEAGKATTIPTGQSVDSVFPQGAYPKRDSSASNWINDGLLMGYEKVEGRKWLDDSAGSNSQQPQTKSALDSAIVYDTDALRKAAEEMKDGAEGGPWFNANHVCVTLGFGNPRQALDSHVDAEDVQKLDTLTSGGRQLQNYVNESGLYALIFGSSKPDAKKFKKWVTSEVLPAIRKTGTYTAKKQPDPPQLLVQDAKSTMRSIYGISP